LFTLLTEDRVRELYIFVNGTEKFFDRYPFMDPWFHPSPQSFVRSASLIATKLDITYNFPSDIWDGRLFLGSYNQVRIRFFCLLLRKKGFTICNCSSFEYYTCG